MGLLSTHIYVFITPQSSSVKGQQGTRHHPCLAVQRHKLLFINSSSRAQCYIGWGKYKQNAHIFSNRNRSRKVCTACSAQENVSLLQNASLPAPRGCLRMAVSRERKEREKERGRERRKKGRGEGRGRKEERKKEGRKEEGKKKKCRHWAFTVSNASYYSTHQSTAFLYIYWNHASWGAAPNAPLTDLAKFSR